MSRTKHHRNQKRQHIGQDLWSRRGPTLTYSAISKFLSKRMERARLKRQLRKEMEDE